MAGPALPFELANFDAQGRQVTRLDTTGQPLDAHDGGIAQWGTRYYLYGTSYGCGFTWRKAGSPFCGFKAYSSSDFVNWVDEGPLFDASGALWQQRCNGSTYGCFRPRVVYNAATEKYVLWINGYDNVSGFHVFDSELPTGPFEEVSEPRLAVNGEAPAAGLNNGDQNLFVDDDGKGYVVFTDWLDSGDIVVEELDATYHTGTGRYARLAQAETEAPAMFRRDGVFYITYSDPNCGYCSGTGTSYKTAIAPLGPWLVGAEISDDSCGGQPSHVALLHAKARALYVYQSDLWRDRAPNEADANLFWAPLSFDAEGRILPLDCAVTTLD